MKSVSLKLLGLALLATSYFSYGQQSNLNNYLQMPAVVPSSPNAASIERFGNIPVDYSTGVPSISIPVWNIKCGSIDWPLSLSYHASGIRVDEIASSVGLGWALNGPALISRSVIGKPDEQWTGNPLYTSVTYNDYNYLYAVRNGQNDAESDIFSYNFNGKSGKFLIKQDGSIFLMPYANLKITNSSFNSFTIIDEKGAVYTFDKKESVSSDANGALSNYTTSWYLTKVQPADRSQSIDFVYTDAGTSIQSFYNFSQSIGVKPIVPGTGCGAPQYTESFSSPTFGRTNNTTGTAQLTQINFPNGYLTLTYANDRMDILGTAKGRLTDIAIYQQTTARLIKKFSLTQSYFLSNPLNGGDPSQYRLRLDQIDEVAGDLSVKKPYKFGYNATQMVPRGNYGQDKWGFNNGHSENTSLIQTETVNFVNGNTYTVGSANRVTDVNLMQACMLSSVTYPTGGKSVYTFEPHQYLTNNAVVTTTSITAYAVGTSAYPQSTATNFTVPSTNFQNVRFKVDLSKYNFSGVTDRPSVKITDVASGNVVYNLSNFTPDNLIHTDNQGTLTSGRTYKAEAFVFSTVSNTQVEARITVQWDVQTGTNITESGGGLRVKEIKNYNSDNSLVDDQVYEYAMGTPLTPFSYVNKTYNDVIYRVGIPLCPPQGGCLYWQSGTCRVYHSASLYPSTTVAGSPILYGNVTKYMKDGSGVDNGKTEYNYDIIQDAEIPVGGPSLFNAHLYTNDWKNGFLTSEIYSKKNGATYAVIQKTENEYAEYKNATAYSLKVYPNYVQAGCELQGPSNVSNDLNFFAFPIYSGSKKLRKTTATSIDNSGNQQLTITSNEYTGLTNDLLTKTTTTDSKNADKITNFKYPVDFSATGNVFEKMVNQNIITPVIDQQTFSGATLLSTVHTTYRDWKNDSKILTPEYLQTSVLSNTVENRVQYYEYNASGNPIAVAKVNDAIQSYVYDYKNSYPVAEVKNAGPSDIAYTSFESDGKGNWAFLGSPVADATAITGKKVYDPANGAISKTVATGGQYVISYWSKNGGKTINGVTAIAGRNVGSWTYYENNVILGTNGTVTISSSGVIDELRLYPAGAKMTSYTYEPLIGQTSMADPNSEIIYYEYDGFNRLKNIKDYQGNIVKNFQYNYANSCGANCVVLQMQTFMSYNTPSYPVGVFNINKQYIDTARTPAEYVTRWNSNSANQAIGVLSVNADSLHFNLNLATNAIAPPVVYGLRFFQWDTYTPNTVHIATDTTTFIDWGDGNRQLVTLPRQKMTESVAYFNTNNQFMYYAIWLNHTYANSQPRTITIFHNETTEMVGLGSDGINDAAGQDANIRGYYPEKVKGIALDQIPNSSDLGIKNFDKLTEVVNIHYRIFWNSIPPVRHNNFHTINHLHKMRWLKITHTFANEIFTDMRSNFPSLQYVEFSLFKPDIVQTWSGTGFPNLRNLSIGTALTSSETDLILNSQATGNNITNGFMEFAPIPTRTAASNTAYNTLISRGWTISINNP